MPTRRLILASSSPRRHQLLREAGYEFESLAPHESVECGICSTGGPASLVVELAMNKAANVLAQLKESGDFDDRCVIIACDTVAECGGMVLGKPADEAHARDMLERLRGSLHRVYSGLCVWQPGSAAAGLPDVRLAVSELRMDPLSDQQLDEYLASGLWEGKAGAFGYQDRAGWLHLSKGSESNVVGLPMELLTEMLAELPAD
ncbi:Maf family protein [Lacipirellula limnantheis]|uniref:dTTP/UTP pyrophosphatase n=1 Tax=Lacipirellula limnantheis TaxID=2528024 RepID=A0A517TZV5_9BACT|nr:Maf family protein [Lacipirellula limnantheis]QDT73904.1 Maf-like protein YhdE [Lacipirellula limnantheis]